MVGHDLSPFLQIGQMVATRQSSGSLLVSRDFKYETLHWQNSTVILAIFILFFSRSYIRFLRTGSYEWAIRPFGMATAWNFKLCTLCDHYKGFVGLFLAWLSVGRTVPSIKPKQLFRGWCSILMYTISMRLQGRCIRYGQIPVGNSSVRRFVD